MRARAGMRAGLNLGAIGMAAFAGSGSGTRNLKKLLDAYGY